MSDAPAPPFKPAPPTASSAAAHALRVGDAAVLAQALADSREQTLRLFAAWQSVLPPSMAVRYAPELNPPRWELGHLAWFEERWIARHPQRAHGAAASPDGPLAASLLPRADALYDSSRVTHAARWHLDLPDAEHTLRYARQVRDRTLALLAELPTDRADDDRLYFFRWTVLHEDMHAEAAAYMAQHLALPLAGALPCRGPAAAAGGDATAADLVAAGGLFHLGHAGPGFAFDNESGAHAVELAPFSIDRSAVTWGRYMPFVEDGGYDDPRWWSAEGWAWRQRCNPGRPRYVTRDGGVWQRASFGEWLPLAHGEPAMHLTRHEAEAWCRWAGRRLPSEAEWEFAALHVPGFDWGEVWEWTATPFAPYAGFVPHPYRDYSLPWFDGRPVLRGGCFATSPRMKHPRYRNFFPADRNDLFAGFRSCAA